MMLRALFLAIATALLAGCATATSERLVCPQVKTYERGFLARVADEMETLPADSATVVVVGDYGELRARLRACRDG
jgi:hypothetical protein